MCGWCLFGGAVGLLIAGAEFLKEQQSDRAQRILEVGAWIVAGLMSVGAVLLGVGGVALISFLVWDSSSLSTEPNVLGMTVALSIPVIASLGVAVSIPYVRARDAVSVFAAAKHVWTAFVYIVHLGIIFALTMVPLGVAVRAPFDNRGWKQANELLTSIDWLFVALPLPLAGMLVLLCYLYQRRKWDAGPRIAERPTLAYTAAILQMAGSAFLGAAFGLMIFALVMTLAWHAPPPHSGPIAIG
jgi:hypothetical protein